MCFYICAFFGIFYLKYTIRCVIMYLGTYYFISAAYYGGVMV